MGLILLIIVVLLLLGSADMAIQPRMGLRPKRGIGRGAGHFAGAHSFPRPSVRILVDMR